MGYFAQFELKVEGVAMVTASHNDNGWTGIKMGMERPLTFAPEDMTALKDIVLKGGFDARNEAGRYIFVPDLPERYLADLLARPKLAAPEAVVCGNGTAGAFAPACSQPSAQRSSRSIAASTTPSPPTTPIPKISPC